MKTFVLGAIAAVAGLAVAGVAQAQTQLRFNWWVPGMHLQRTKIAEPWIKSVEEATQGRVKITLTATSLAPPLRQFDMIVDGIADIAFAAHGYTPDRFILPVVTELPFMGEKAEGLSVALWRAHEKYFAAKDEFKGVKLLGLYTHGAGGLWSQKEPITSLNNIKGLKIRAGGGMQDEIVKALGGVSVVSPAPTTYEVLSRGVVDATLFDANSIASFKLEKLVKYYLDVPGSLYNSSFYYIMNSAKWAALSKADQDAITRVSGEVLARMAGKAWDGDDAAVTAQFPALGTQVTKAQGPLLADMKTALKPIEDKWIADAQAKRGVNGAEIIAFIRDNAK